MSYLSPIDAAQIGFDPFAVDGDDGLDPVADSDGDSPDPGAAYAAPAADGFEDGRAAWRQGPDQPGDVDAGFGRTQFGDRFNGDDIRGRFDDRDDRRTQGGRVIHEGVRDRDEDLDNDRQARAPWQRAGLREARIERLGGDFPYPNGGARPL